MTHLTLDQLVRLREPGVEPGQATARDHLNHCPVCRLEADRLEQRVARLKALPVLRPVRDSWPVLRTRVLLERRRRRTRFLGMAGLAIAATVVLMLLVRDLSTPTSLNATAALSDAMDRSSQLENLLQSYNPDERITDGHTERVAGALEDRIARIDRELEMTQLLRAQQRDPRLLQLYRERNGLLGALVDVRVTRASNLGL
jgi:hypothetical protein